MSSFMDLQYDSDSDSANDLDFEPANSNSNSSGSVDSDSDQASNARDQNDTISNEDPNENIEAREIHASASIMENRAKPSPADLVDSSSLNSALPNKEKTLAVLDTPSTTAKVSNATVKEARPSPSPSKAKAPKKKLIATSASIKAIESSDPKTDQTAAVDDNAPAPDVIVKKKKGPKPGTKYKKRTPAGEKVAGKGKRAAVSGQDTVSKRGKTSKKVQEMVSESALQPSIRHTTIGLNSVPLDLEHPLEAFKWPYSPFTSEFRNQHALRNSMVQDTSSRLEELRKSNSIASVQLQQLDYQLQSNRQDLKTSLDEIQFRRSQLREMSAMAVDIVKRLCHPRISDQRTSGHLDHGQPTSAAPTRNLTTPPTSANHAEGTRPASVGAETSIELWRDEHKPPCQVSIDQAGLNEGLHLQAHQGQPPRQTQQEPLPILKRLNESNIRTFLEKMRELEKASIHSGVIGATS
ncbi:hypothetical protein EMPS_06341 [Entomortierella parvispora]|uniref:Uncharacterized protein n=1 Tax=Entomortierella parvispora TaxID=205924 RepID=A0A9P3HCS8_9FUNG|nr:hypothetical protein EMPS_06341 [Entomortierella parvispora]